MLREGYCRLTAEHRQKISQSLVGKVKKPRSEQHIQNLRLSRLRTREQNKKSERRSKVGRVNALARLISLNIPPNEDIGAAEFFKRINEDGNFNFKPKRFPELGYVADGYDETHHIWWEYDTPYHEGSKQKILDKIRQDTIIRHFLGLGKPLIFVRTRVDRFGRVKSETVVKRRTPNMHSL